MEIRHSQTTYQPLAPRGTDARTQINSLHTGKLSDFFLSFLFFFFKLFFFNYFRNSIILSNSLNPDEAQHFVGPNQGTNCLQQQKVLLAGKELRNNRHTLA